MPLSPAAPLPVPPPVVHDDPVTDLATLRRCLGNFGTGVTIMTTWAEGAPAGMTANSFATVSLEPPLILWSVIRTSASAPAFLKAERFAVNILAASQLGLCKAFARTASDKFSGVDWEPGLGGVPILAGATATLECRMVRQVEGGDHIVLFGQIERMRSADQMPLLYVQGRFAVPAPSDA